MGVLFFTADWCHPCEAMKSYIYKYSGKIPIKTIDVEKDSRTPARYGVRGLPTLIILDGEKVKDVIVGTISEEQFKQKLGV